MRTVILVMLALVAVTMPVWAELGLRASGDIPDVRLDVTELALLPGK